MQFEKIHNKGQARLFRNSYLEQLTKTHPLVIWAIYLPMAIFLWYFSFQKLQLPLGIVCCSFFAGVFFWTLFEYMLHRFVFHFIAESKRIKRIVYLIHGNHHQYPRDKERLFMPPVPSLFIAAALFFMLLLSFEMAGIKEYVFSFFAGFLLGYLLYGSMHYAIHAWNPPFKWMKALWRNHHLHHYKQQGKGFGVSSTLWDHVFGTMFDVKHEKEDRDKSSELMLLRKSRPQDN